MRKQDIKQAIGMWAASLILMFGLLFLVHACHAHDHNHPELNGWLMSLRNNKGVPCCDGSDATRLSDVDWESKDGHYRVRLMGDDWVDVPDEAVIEQPNRAGQTLVWPYYLNGQLRGIRCFMPGSMT